jgi:hypothetical protein
MLLPVLRTRKSDGRITTNASFSNENAWGMSLAVVILLVGRKLSAEKKRGIMKYG